MDNKWENANGIISQATASFPGGCYSGDKTWYSNTKSWTMNNIKKTRQKIKK